MKKKILSICMCLTLLLSIFLVNDVGVQAAEHREGFQVTMSTDDQLTAGAEVSFNITVTNTSGKDLSRFAISHDCYDRNDTSGNPPDSLFGQIFDANGQNIDNGELNIEIKSGETQKYTLKGTLPNDWGSYHQIWIIATGLEGENNTVIYYGNAGTEFSPSGGVENPGEDTEPGYEDDYLVTVTPDKEVKPGQTVTFYVSITNRTDMAQQVTWMNPWYYREMDNSETYPGVTFGVTRDSAGNVIIDDNKSDIYNITFAAGESKEYTVTGTIPATWGDKSQILVVIRSKGADGKEYGAQGEYSGIEQPDIPNNIEAAVSGNAGSVIAVSEYRLISAALTPEEIASGDDIKIVLNTNIALESSISAKDKDSIMKAAGERKIAQILDLTIQKNNETKNTTETVSNLLAPIYITIDIPDEYLNVPGRTFSVIRLHGDAATVLDDLDADPDTVTISTDKFSLYTLAYKDGGTSGADTVFTPADNQNTNNSGTSGTTTVARSATPRTGDTSNIAVYLVLCAAMAGIIAGISIKKRQAGRDML